MNIKDFRVGQTVYVELTGNASRGKTLEQCIEEWEITSIGRKCIKAYKKGNPLRSEIIFKFNENGKIVDKTDCRPDYIIYNTRQEIEEKHEKKRLIQGIRRQFEYSPQKGISLEQLRAIHNILEGGNEGKWRNG